MEFTPFWHPSHWILSCFQNSLIQIIQVISNSVFLLASPIYPPSSLVTFLLCAHVCVCVQGIQIMTVIHHFWGFNVYIVQKVSSEKRDLSQSNLVWWCMIVSWSVMQIFYFFLNGLHIIKIGKDIISVVNLCSCVWGRLVTQANTIMETDQFHPGIQKIHKLQTQKLWKSWWKTFILCK